MGLSQKAEILLGYFRDNKSQRAISRELKISRDTVSKYIKEFESKSQHLDELQKDKKRNEEQILLLIEEMSSTPKYDTSSRTRIKLTERELVYDNLKQAVRKFVGRTEKEATEDLIKMSLYYGFKYRFCNVASGNEKGHVERGIEFVRRKAFSIKNEFSTVEDANIHLQEKLLELNSRKRNWLQNQSPIDMLSKEMPYLLPLKPSYDTSRRIEVRVNKYSVINIDQNRYSVPDYLVGKFVRVKIYPDIIKIYYKDNKIAEHTRSYQAHHWTIDINHFIHTLKKKPGALHSSVGRHQLSPELQETYQQYYINNPREFIELLELIKEKDVESVLKAIEELKAIKKELVTTDNIKNIIFRLPREDTLIQDKDISIQNASIKQIATLNEIFNLKPMGRYEN